MQASPRPRRLLSRSWIPTTALRPMHARVIVDAFEREDCDVLTFGANPYPLEAGYPWLNYVLSPRDVSFEGYSSDLLFKEASRPFAWRTACKRDFLLGNGIVFDETVKYGEDQVFDFAVYGRSHKTALISNKLYDYRVARKGSLMDTMRYDDETRLLEHVKIYSAVLTDWQRDGLDAQHAEDLAYFLCDLVLYDALRLLGSDCGKVLAAVAVVLNGSAVSGDAALAQCAPAVAAMVRAGTYQQGSQCSCVQKAHVRLRRLEVWAPWARASAWPRMPWESEKCRDEYQAFGALPQPGSPVCAASFCRQGCRGDY